MGMTRKPFAIGRHRRVHVVSGHNGTAWVSHIVDGAAPTRISVTHAPPGGTPRPVATYGLGRDIVRLGGSTANVGAWADAEKLAASLVA